MDTSETYLKMSTKARKDLVKWYAVHLDVKGLTDRVVMDDKGNFWATQKGRYPVQLFRQDQLQEFVFPDKSTSARQMCETILDFTLGRWLPVMCSMEQLLLMALMYHEYKKTWDGEGWTKDS